MADESNVNQVQDKSNDKELNFRQLEMKHQREMAQAKAMIDQERAARVEAERIAQEKRHVEEADDDSEPYVDHKRLDKKLAKFGNQTQTEIEKAMAKAKTAAKEELKQEMWLENNPDFYDVLQNAEKLAQKDPDLANSILEMPEGFARQKLVYKNIKALGLHKPEAKAPSIQEKVDANRRSPYYQPSGVGSAPYASAGDFSPQGQKQAHDKMQELKNRLRI